MTDQERIKQLEAENADLQTRLSGITQYGSEEAAREIADLKAINKRAHEVFGQESDKLGQLVAELKAKLEQAHKDYGHELRDPNGTIWDECRRLQRKLSLIRQLVLDDVPHKYQDRLLEVLK